MSVLDRLLSESVEITNFHVQLDHPSYTYYAGAKVTGKVKIEFTRAKKVLSLIIKINGEAKVEFVGYEDIKYHIKMTRDRYTVYKGKEVLFSYTHILVGGPEGSVEVPEGRHAYNFCAKLPHNVPSSFEGNFGYIRYTATATLQRPWKFNQEARALFHVISPLDLNKQHGITKPVLAEKTKKLWHLRRQPRKIQLVVYMPHAGFTAGQSIPLSILAINKSTCQVRYLMITLYKTIVWMSRQPEVRERKQVHKVSEVTLEGVNPRTAKHWNHLFTVPLLPALNFSHCLIISCSYSITVKAAMGWIHKDMKLEIPVYFGTTPMVDYDPDGSIETAEYPVVQLHPESATDLKTELNVTSKSRASKASKSSRTKSILITETEARASKSSRKKSRVVPESLPALNIDAADDVQPQVDQNRFSLITFDHYSQMTEDSQSVALGSLEADESLLSIRNKMETSDQQP